MYECINCGHRTVYWQSDFDAEDIGYDEPGVVSYWTCAHCGAEIEVYVKEKNDGAED